MEKIEYDRAYIIAKDILKTDKFELAEFGRNNWVFLTNELVMSIPRNGNKIQYNIRVAATKKLMEHNIPTTDVVDYNNKNGIEYIITKKIEGSNIDLNKISLNERNELHFNTGKILKNVHSIKTESFGRMDEKSIGTSKTWKKFVENYFLESMNRVYKTKFLVDKYGRKIESSFTNNLNLCDTVNNPSFLHGDYHLGNLLFKNNRVSALLDLDIVTSGDTAWDIGHYSRTFNKSRKEGMKHFRKGYGGEYDLKREDFYSLIIWTRKIGTQALTRPKALKESILEIEKILYKGAL